MAQCSELSRELFPELFNVSQIAGRLLIAWRGGERTEWMRQWEMARLWAAHTRPSSTLEMERLEALSGALESLGRPSPPNGAIRLLEQLAGQFAASTPAVSGWSLLPGKPAVVPYSQFVQ